MKKWKETHLLFSGLILITFGLLLISFSDNAYLFLGAVAFAIAGQAITRPVITSLFTKFANEKQVGQTLGITNSVSGFAGFLGTIWAGFIFQQLGFNSPFLMGSILMFIAAILTWNKILPRVKKG